MEDPISIAIDRQLTAFFDPNRSRTKERRRFENSIERLFINAIQKKEKWIIELIFELKRNGFGSRSIADKLGIKRQMVRRILSNE